MPLPPSRPYHLTAKAHPPASALVLPLVPPGVPRLALRALGTLAPSPPRARLRIGTPTGFLPIVLLKLPRCLGLWICDRFTQMHYNIFEGF